MFAALAFAALFTACQKDQVAPTGVDDAMIELMASVEPVLIDPWQSGNAAFECSQYGSCGDFAYKIDNWNNSGMDGSYSDPNALPGTAAANVITIYNSDGYTFSWTSEYEVCKVIVKGGTGAYIYEYPDGSCGDEGLTAPLKDIENPANGTREISHVSFCWNDTECDEEPNACYQDETAWAFGDRYVKKGNWAMYVKYTGVEKTVDVIAGQNMVAGTATFSAPINGGTQITIAINLTNSLIFYYDLYAPIGDDNVKVQDYASKPSGNPAPGLFAWKETALYGSTSYTITVPKNNYYGVHLDVAYEVPCE
jgi:hypothetical protein